MYENICKHTFLAKKVIIQTISLKELKETNDFGKSDLSILFRKDLNVFRETLEDWNYKSELGTKNTKSEDFSNNTKYSHEEVNLPNYLEENMNSSNNRIEVLNKNNTIKIASNDIDNKALLGKDKTQRNVTSRSANTLFLLLRIVKSLPMFVNQWMVIFVLFSCVCALKEQRFAIEPQDQVSFRDFYCYQRHTRYFRPRMVQKIFLTNSSSWRWTRTISLTFMIWCNKSYVRFDFLQA